MLTEGTCKQSTAQSSTRSVQAAERVRHAASAEWVQSAYEPGRAGCAHGGMVGFETLTHAGPHAHSRLLPTYMVGMYMYACLHAGLRTWYLHI